MKTIAGVISLFGVINASQRISAAKNPNRSATPMPSIATKINGNAGIWAKLRSIEESIQYTPSALSKLFGVIGSPLSTRSTTGLPKPSRLATCTAWPVASSTPLPCASICACITICGLTGCTLQPAELPMADSTITASASIANRIAGSGSLLPAHSIQSSTLRDGRGADGDSGFGPGAVPGVVVMRRWSRWGPLKRQEALSGTPRAVAVPSPSTAVDQACRSAKHRRPSMDDVSAVARSAVLLARGKRQFSRPHAASRQAPRHRPGESLSMRERPAGPRKLARASASAVAHGHSLLYAWMRRCTRGCCRTDGHDASAPHRSLQRAASGGITACERGRRFNPQIGRGGIG